MTRSVEHEMTIYIANVKGQKLNTAYPYEVKVTCAEDMAKAAAFDNVSADYKDATTKSGKFVRRHRAKADFIAADNINMDCDNDEQDPTKPDLPPEQWKGPDDVQAAFPGVAFWFVPSRNHMKVKNGKPARPKGHYYFPQAKPIADFEKWTALKVAVRDRFPAFDEKALDAAHFLFGVDDPQPVYYPGDLCIDEYMEQVAAERKAEQTAAQPKQAAGNEVIPVGSRNTTLSRFAATVLKKYGAEDGKALEAFRSRAAQCEQPLDASELQGIWKSAKSNYIKNTSKAPGYVPPAEYAAQEFAQSLEPTDYTDLGQATLFAALYGDRVKYTPATKWIVFDGKVWQESELKARALVHELTDRQLAESRKRLKAARAAEDAAVEAGDEEAVKRAKEQAGFAKLYRAFVLEQRKSARITATLKEAEPKLEIPVNLLDRDPYKLNTPAGTVNLKTGTLHPHEPGDYCTKITGCSPSTEGAEEFATFLDRLTCNDRDYARYLQEEAGLCAIGRVMREQMGIANGAGGNGKSTMFNAQSYVLGDYAGRISSEILTAQCRKNKSPELAELRGMRLVIAAELEEGMRLDTATVKQLCSTDEIQAEKKYKDPFKFVPSHTVILYTNHLPKVGTLDKGTWDRLIVMPFNARFRGMQGEILNYGQYLFDHAGGAILQWIIEGAQRVIANNYHIDEPECVKQAIAAYRDNNNWLEAFLRDCCEVDPAYTQKSGELYQRYSTYCDAMRDYRRSLADFKAALTDAGYMTRKTMYGAIVYGLRVKSDFLEVDEPTPWDDEP
jgi:putative DNA primase/helicase